VLQESQIWWMPLVLYLVRKLATCALRNWAYVLFIYDFMVLISIVDFVAHRFFDILFKSYTSIYSEWQLRIACCCFYFFCFWSASRLYALRVIIYTSFSLVFTSLLSSDGAVSLHLLRDCLVIVPCHISRSVISD